MEIKFSLHQRKSNNKWYAQGRIDGKQVAVYLGVNPDKAKEKIEQWKVKKGLESAKVTISSKKDNSVPFRKITDVEQFADMIASKVIERLRQESSIEIIHPPSEVVNYKIFVERVKTICKEFENQNNESAFRIHQIRDRMPECGVSTFDEYMRKMEKDRLCYFVGHSDPRYIKANNIKGYLEDKHRGILYYLVWR